MRAAVPGLAVPVNKDTNADAEIPYHRLYVGNLYYNLTADDISKVFMPFGELAFVDLPMEPHVSTCSSGCCVDDHADRTCPLSFCLHRLTGVEATLLFNFKTSSLPKQH